jgi:hypothetical protein
MIRPAKRTWPLLTVLGGSCWEPLPASDPTIVRVLFFRGMNVSKAWLLEMPMPSIHDPTRASRAAVRLLAPPSGIGTVAWMTAMTAIAVGCHSPMKTVPLLTTAGVPWTVTPRPEVPLEIITRATSIPDPMPVSGANVSYSDVEDALGHAAASATVPWAEAHRAQRPDGWQLFVELVQADASYEDQRLKVVLSARATLRTRVGRAYLAQTHVHCNQAGVVPPAEGAPILYSCMSRLSRDLAAWLGGLEP